MFGETSSALGFLSESIEAFFGVLTSNVDYFLPRWMLPMPAKRSNVRTLQTVYRTYRLPPQIRRDMGAKRKQFGLTVAEFLSQAIGHELPRIATDLEKVGLPASTSGQDRPARLPLSDELLKIAQVGQRHDRRAGITVAGRLHQSGHSTKAEVDKKLTGCEA